MPLLPGKWLYPLAQALGTAAFALAGGARRAAQANISPIVETTSLGRVVRQMFVHNAQYYLSLFARR
ncbi:MAG: hypothetical protein KGJ86_02905, partial [Chloroflexota bacterium]|nr:hypothetical protein [Chloroflexota bacterium]